MRILPTLTALLLCMQVYSADYYWVGGSGNWSDISHWAAASGGTVKYPVAPSSEDNVIFDENSFTAPGQTVNFINVIVFCKTMDWSAATNNPTLAGPENVTINIFGDLILGVDMDITFEGKFLMTGIEEDKNIEFNNQLIPGVVTFAGESSWSINGNTSIDSMLEISRGNVAFNGNAIECRFLHINSNGQKVVDISNSTVTISGTYLPEYGYNGDGAVSLIIQHDFLDIDAGGSTIDISAPNPEFRYFGTSDIVLNDLSFSAQTGLAVMTSEWYEEPITISDLNFESSALILGTVNAASISFGAGGRYRFGAERVYEFGEIQAVGDCVEGVILTSDNPGTEVVFNVASGIIDLEFITLRDIHGGGGATLNANNGVDLGNNDGWIFTNSVAVDYFWIGGNGEWDDPQHWSFTSGGPPAGCVPSGKDNAFFDVNSFTGPNQSVSLSSRTTYIHNMTWDGVLDSPEFTSLGIQRMVVTGSLELDEAMEHDIAGFYDFESSEAGNTIRMNGNIFNESITFSGAMADWSFLDDLEVYRVLYFTSGRISTGGNQLTTTRFQSNSRQERVLDLTGSYVLMREIPNLDARWLINQENYLVDATNSTIEFSDRAIFSHEGRGSLGKPRYNNLLFSNDRGEIRSIDGLTPDSETAVIVNNLVFAGRGNFAGSTEIGTLTLAAGFSYVFDSNLERRQVIGDLIAQGSCENGNTIFFGSIPGVRGDIELANDETLDRMNITDIEILGGSLTNNNSIDGGNNAGMIFNEQTGRTLFWVDDGGIWHDPAHWSLSSGGPGGECIPTAIDDVIFDANSFSQPDQVVDADPNQFAICKDILAVGITDFPRLSMNFLLVNGSLEFDFTFDNAVNEHIFTSSENETILVAGQNFNNIRVRGNGEFTYLDNIVFNNMYYNSGTITLADINLLCQAIYTEGNVPKQMNLGNSVLVMTSNGIGFNDQGFNLSVSPGNSEMILEGVNTGIYSRSNISLNKVIFSNPQGKGTLISRRGWDVNNLEGTMSVNHLRFNGNGEITTHLTADTIIGVSGKLYIFERDRDIDVSSYLQLRGNNCTPIEVRSSINAEKSRINMPSSAEVLVDFVQMKDMEAAGGADFNAGSRSINVGGSNIGWVFTDAPDFIESGFLGEDFAICAGEPVELTAFSYSVNEQYLWSDGSADSTLQVDAPGLYFVEVQFESNCVLVDTIDIIDGQQFDADLPDSTIICALTSAELDASIEDQDVNYLWSTGSTDSVIVVESEGKYTVQVEALGCISLDSTIVSFVEDPGEFLPRDSTLCNGEEYVITPLLEVDTYEWQNGMDTRELNISIGGIYWLDIAQDGCVFRDTFLAEALFGPEIDLGMDTAICANTELTIDLDPDLRYEWNNGSSSSTFVISSEGNFAVQVSGTNRCTSSDSIFVSILPAPEFDLGDDIESCGATEVSLNAPADLMDFTWEDGSASELRIITEEGQYSISAVENGCSGSDSVFISFLTLPEIDLGPLDTLACDDEALRIKPVSAPAGDLTWQNSSDEDYFDATVPGLVVATVFNGECFNSDSILVTFKECTFFDIYVPNAFSPNEDGYNDEFEVFFPENLVIESFSIIIFDRWGNRVFSSKEVGKRWDGTLDSSDLLEGVYIYAINLDYIDDDGPGSEEIRGDIAIIR